MSKDQALAALLVALLLLWLNRRREEVTSTITPGPALDWWQVWEYMGGGPV